MSEEIKARNSFGEDYVCKQPWTCFVQCGSSGVVFNKEGGYQTAFFEAFPKDPSCFLRGEGSTIEEAEQKCWDKYQVVKTCDHEMERRNRTDGYAYCKHCSYARMFFEPLTKCKICKVPTAYTSDKDGKNHYCKKHNRFMPKDKRCTFFKNDVDRYPRKLKKELKFYAKFRFEEKGYVGKIKLKLKDSTSISGKFECGPVRLDMLMGAKYFLKNSKSRYHELYAD